MFRLGRVPLILPCARCGCGGGARRTRVALTLLPQVATLRVRLGSTGSTLPSCALLERASCLLLLAPPRLVVGTKKYVGVAPAHGRLPAKERATPGAGVLEAAAAATATAQVAAVAATATATGEAAAAATAATAQAAAAATTIPHAAAACLYMQYGTKTTHQTRCQFKTVFTDYRKDAICMGGRTEDARTPGGALRCCAGTFILIVVGFAKEMIHKQLVVIKRMPVHA